VKNQFNFDEISQKNLCTQKIEAFYQNTALTKKSLNVGDKLITLSKREAECLEGLALGKSMKEIGKLLDLSPRTIEFYLNNIKDKTGIRSKEEIIVNFIKKNQV
jgi:DNA-binding CsgD family transcriptional regulator